MNIRTSEAFRNPSDAPPTKASDENIGAEEATVTGSLGPTASEKSPSEFAAIPALIEMVMVPVPEQELRVIVGESVVPSATDNDEH